MDSRSFLRAPFRVIPRAIANVNVHDCPFTSFIRGFRLREPSETIGRRDTKEILP